MSSGLGPAVPTAIAEALRHGPHSVLVYARDRGTLDPFVASIAELVQPEFTWIEVTGADWTPRAGPATDPSSPRARGPRFDYTPDQLLPDYAGSHLGLWAAGNRGDQSSAVDELADFSWLPAPLRELARSADAYAGGAAVVIAPAELMVLNLPMATDDVRRLLSTLRRRGISLIAGLLIRPIPPFPSLFDFVVRLRPPAPDSGDSFGTALVERAAEEPHRSEP